MTVDNVIGWIGVLAYTLAYVFLSMGWLKPNRVVYHAMNVVGGLCLFIVSYELSDMPNVIVNLVWCIIALGSIARIIFQKVD